MASVTIEAGYASRHCKARLAEIEKQFEVDKAAWFATQRTTKRRRGVWPFRYYYYPTEGELERSFCGSDCDDWIWWSPEYGLRRRTARERSAMREIIEAAEVALESASTADGDGNITLSGDETSTFHRIISTATKEAA
jgi:hypothetical protein